jgi:predicted SAM-dependent methyltransferase
MGFWDRRPSAARRALDEAPPAFSLRRLARENPALARQFLWGTNSLPDSPDPLWLHLGCGERVFDRFVNLDFIPHDDRVGAWNLLDVWPDELAGRVAGIFSEDVLEHFFLGEQTYVLCNANRVLADGGVARTLMPSLARLVDYRANYRPAPDELLHSAFGVHTGGDALNIGMRFSGHRWLHDAQSLARLASTCGFEAHPTTCASSTVPRFDGLNLRDEAGSLSFATDLAKVAPVQRLSLAPVALTGATVVEELDHGIRLCVATAPRPSVEYRAPAPVDAASLACLNVRSANASSFHEHNLKSLVVDGINRERPWWFDETMKSRPCMNVVTRDELRVAIGDARFFSTLRFSPAAEAGEYFTLGDAELFTVG